ncbi:MAG: L-fucose:H+ symporter permease [Bacteroidales bacterium]
MENNLRPRLVPAGIIFPFILITSLFFLWGVANNMTDTLLSAFKRIMSMSDSQTALIQVVFYGAGYGLLAIPAAIFIKKYTYKAGILLGLGLYSVGAILFFPAKLTADYYWFLAAIWILSAGLSILETAANPYILSMGSDETATRRLNLAQSFNPIGSITGILLSQQFILSKLNKAGASERSDMSPEILGQIQSGELNAVTMTYVSLGLLLIVIWVLIAINRKMPKTAEAGGPLNFSSTFGRLFKKKHYVWGVIAQFFYVGAQIGVWSFTIRYVMKELNLEEIAASTAGKTAEQMAANYYLASLVLFTASRFICTWLMKYITPAKLLTSLALLAIVLSALVIYAGGYTGVYALVGISGCMSLMFPTIFGLACRGLGEDTKLGGSGLILAIFGGAVFTQIQGVVSDATGSINLAFLVPLVCFAVIAYYGVIAKKHSMG